MNNNETANKHFYAHSLAGRDKSKWHLLAKHLQDTAQLAGEFARHFGAGAEILARQAGLLHDLGKYSAEFQARLTGNPAQVNHSTHGAQIAIERFGKLGYFIAYAIAGHHAGLADGEGFAGKRRSLAERRKDELPKLSTAWQKEIALAEAKDFHKYLRGMTQIKGFETFQCAFLIRMLFSSLIDADRLDTENFYARAEKQNIARGFADTMLIKNLRNALDTHLQKFTENPPSQLNAWRHKILTTVRTKASYERGQFSLTVPTGGGKTLTSLAFALDHALAHGLRRVIYVIPYTNIIEQTAEVFRNALGKHQDKVLEHHSGFSVDSKDDRYQGQEKLKLAMENWDAPIIVTTAVQFFESLFSSRPSSCRKLHNIANSVVILDEVQTTPLCVLRPCVMAVKELVANYQSSVVLCTATQPALGAEKFIDGFRNVRELAPERQAMFAFFKRVTIDPQIKKWDDTTLTQKIRAQEQVLCIVNNRRHARALVDSLADCAGVRLLTTLMCAKHRQKVLREIRDALRANMSCRVIATSLVEAGVDLDFPMVLRAEAGLDSIAQAAGRCNREGKRARAESEVFIFTPDSEKWRPPTELKQFAQVMRGCLRNGGDPLSTETMENYFRNLYWQKGDQQLDTKGILPSLRGSKLESLPMEKIDRDFVMLDNYQAAIIIRYDGEAEKLLSKLQYMDNCGGIARQLQPYIVQVPQYVYDKMHKAGLLECVAKEKSAQQFVTLATKDARYHTDYGLCIDDLDTIPAASCVM